MSVKLSVIEAGTFKLDGGAMFGVVPKKIWQSLNEPDENNLCTWALRCLLVELDNRKILIDCGMGNKQDSKFFGHYQPNYEQNLTTSLNNIGLKKEDITDVFLTHLHFDHCGGAIEKDSDNNLIPAFKNAIYWSNEQHWKWATEPNPREKASFLKENILPIKDSGKLNMVKIEDGIEIYNGFKVRFAYGHTEAMMLPEIKTDNGSIIYAADLLPSKAHIQMPYVMSYDVRPLLTMQEKATILNDAYNNESYFYFEHDKNIELCKVEKTEKGIVAGKTFKLNEIF